MNVGVEEKFEVPEGVELKLTGKTVEVSGPKGKLTKTFDLLGITVKADGRKVLINADSARRKNKAAVSAIKAHLQNMAKGVADGFTYKLRIVYSHFPITIKVDGKRVMTQNFLGERSPRVAKIVGEAKVALSGEEIIVQGLNKEEVGQTALNIERSTSIRHRDLRTFKDGCYIVERA